jgi:Na+/H+ antiporter NhaD/arsenite permease-like protein
MRNETSARSRWPIVLSLLLVGAVVAVAFGAALAHFWLPHGDSFDKDSRSVAAAVVFAGSYLALAVGRIPGLNIDRAGIALVGAGLMVASSALPLEDAYKAVDLETLSLLLGMMIVVASLRLSGFFALATAWVIARAGRSYTLLAAIVLTSGFFSAFLVNDAICLVLAPLVLDLTLALKRRPAPYLLAVAMASNVGSTATITGNPQNIMIGGFSRIPYAAFATALAPVAAVGLGRYFRATRAVPLARAYRRNAAGSSAAKSRRQSRAGDPRRGGDARHDRAVLRRRHAGQGGDRHRRPVAADPAGEKPKSL